MSWSRAKVFCPAYDCVTVNKATLTSRLPRRVDYFHMPVPRDRHDVDYFKPLADLCLGRDAALYLGLSPLRVAISAASVGNAAGPIVFEAGCDALCR
jgi:hypothetical protein